MSASPFDSNQMLPVPPDRPFRILQLTDFHSDVSEALNEKTRFLVQGMVQKHNPDFLAVTGDIWCGDTHPDAAPMWMKRDLAFLGSLGIPWAFVWGNHDYAWDIHDAWRSIMNTPNYQVPTAFHGNHYRITLTLEGSTHPVWDLFFLHSGLEWSIPENFSWLEAESKRLQLERGKVLPSVIFFHIPLKCYQDAVDSGKYTGIALEPVLYWGDEAGTGSDIIKNIGGVRACFCGHSHRCDFHFIEEDVIFAYGRVTGFGGYGEDMPRGGKLIQLNTQDGTVSFQTVF